MYARFEVAPQPQTVRNIQEQRMEIEELRKIELEDNREQEIGKQYSKSFRK